MLIIEMTIFCSAHVSLFQDLAVMESMQSALENVVNAVFDGSNVFGRGSSEVQLALCRRFEGFFPSFSYLSLVRFLLGSPNKFWLLHLKVYSSNFLL